MSRGKYSLAYKNWPGDYDYKYNCLGKPAEPYTEEMVKAGVEFNPQIHAADHDEEGYDWYGYSAFDRNGVYVGTGQGTDREGWTEMDYLTLQDLSEAERDAYYD